MHFICDLYSIFISGTVRYRLHKRARRTWSRDGTRVVESVLRPDRITSWTTALAQLGEGRRHRVRRGASHWANCWATWKKSSRRWTNGWKKNTLRSQAEVRIVSRSVQGDPETEETEHERTVRMGGRRSVVMMIRRLWWSDRFVIACSENLAVVERVWMFQCDILLGRCERYYCGMCTSENTVSRGVL